MKRVVLWAQGAVGEVIAAALLGAGDIALCRDREALDEVLIWHEDKPDAPLIEEMGKRLTQRFRAGMGLVLLGGAVFSQPAQSLFGLKPAATPLAFHMGRMWLVDRTHPILEGMPAWIDLPPERVWYPPNPSQPCDGLLCLNMLDGCALVRSGFWYESGGRAVCLGLGSASYALKPVARLLSGAVHWVHPALGGITHMDQ